MESGSTDVNAAEAVYCCIDLWSGADEAETETETEICGFEYCDEASCVSIDCGHWAIEVQSMVVWRDRSALCVFCLVLSLGRVGGGADVVLGVL